MDFGITSEATSSQGIPTLHARGTGGYRAPEILNENPVFTNKVDIWALGCIFFELSVGKQAFHDDWSVREYHSKSEPMRMRISPPLGFTLFIDNGSASFKHDNSLLCQLLARDPMARPRVEHLRVLFKAQCALSNVANQTQIRSRVPPGIPSYEELFRSVERCKDKSELFHVLITLFEKVGNMEGKCILLESLVADFPANNRYRQHLGEMYKKLNNWRFAAQGWGNLVEIHSFNKHFRDEFTAACKNQEHLEFALSMWAGIIKKYPRNKCLLIVYAKLLVEARREEGDLSAAIPVLRALLYQCPDDSSLQTQLNLACKNVYDNGEEIEIWKGLVDAHPFEDGLASQLKVACKEQGDEEKAVAVWKALVDKHPEATLLQVHLRHALHEMGDEYEAIAVWEGLVEKYPQHEALKLELKLSLETTTGSIDAWRALLDL